MFGCALPPKGIMVGKGSNGYPAGTFKGKSSSESQAIISNFCAQKGFGIAPLGNGIIDCISRIQDDASNVVGNNAIQNAYLHVNFLFTSVPEGTYVSTVLYTETINSFGKRIRNQVDNPMEVESLRIKLRAVGME